MKVYIDGTIGRYVKDEPVNYEAMSQPADRSQENVDLLGRVLSDVLECPVTYNSVIAILEELEAGDYRLEHIPLIDPLFESTENLLGLIRRLEDYDHLFYPSGVCYDIPALDRDAMELHAKDDSQGALVFIGVLEEGFEVYLGELVVTYKDWSDETIDAACEVIAKFIGDYQLGSKD